MDPPAGAAKPHRPTDSIFGPNFNRDSPKWKQLRSTKTTHRGRPFLTFVLARRRRHLPWSSDTAPLDCPRRLVSYYRATGFTEIGKGRAACDAPGQAASFLRRVVGILFHLGRTCSEGLFANQYSVLALPPHAPRFATTLLSFCPFSHVF